MFKIGRNSLQLQGLNSMNLKDPNIYTNRELSWLDFNERVLEEAQDKSNPLMERLKFLAITASNLDEFFMIRVSSTMRSTSTAPDPSGLTPPQILDAMSTRIRDMMAKQYSCLKRSLIPAMEKEGIFFRTYDKLSDAQKIFVDDYFTNVLYQVLTPMAIDQSRPFPSINNLQVYIFIELVTPDTRAIRTSVYDAKEERWRIADDEHYAEEKYAIVQVPTVVPRIVKLPSENSSENFYENGEQNYIFIEDIILANIEQLFFGHNVTQKALFRVTRNSDLIIDEEEAEDLMYAVSSSIKDRRLGDPVRIEITKGIGQHARKLLERVLQLNDSKIYDVSGPLDLRSLMKFATSSGFSHLLHKKIKPSPVPAFSQGSMFDVIKRKDVLVHHPYMSFDCVVDFINEAAGDPGVLAIKQTLYRVSGDSPIIHALINAAEKGKQVSVLVELKARFDEENNINWARVLEKSGVHVIYGLTGLKTHCKICLVVRKEGDAIRRYMHLGTGNYNETTAKIYTDFGYFTCRESFGQDASNLFNVLTGHSKVTKWQSLAVAPSSLRPKLMKLIETEIANANAGKPAYIKAKMNSLSDIPMIQALYHASCAGVKIDLLVRGICCLRPGIKGVSENITVSSIVDRYLEHSRVYIFANAGDPKVFLSSADWMGRNLNRRVEIMFPIEDAELRAELIELVKISFEDNVKRRETGEDGIYRKPSRRGKSTVHSQLEHHRRVAQDFANSNPDYFLPEYSV